jgi:SAM-dependent methyltransferase
MNERILKWDQRFAAGEDLGGGAPSPLLARAIEGVEPGVALDLACGTGRHALFLAERGWRVVAVDGSQAAIDRMLADPRARGIEARIADLEAPGFRLDGQYDLVCDFFFLHRPLLAQVPAVVKPGGRFAAAIHVRSRPDEKGRFLLESGELRDLAGQWGFSVLHHHEGAQPEPGHRHFVTELVAAAPG